MSELLHSLVVFLISISPLVLSLMLLSYLSGKLLNAIGRPLTMILGFLFVPLHELSHLIMALCFGHKILAVKFYTPSPADGRLGYVQTSYRRSLLTPLALLLIGMAPLLIGSAVMVGVTYFWMPKIYQYISTVDIGSPSDWFFVVLECFEILITSPWFISVPWVVFALSLIVFSVPSSADIKGCKSALLLLVACFVVAGIVSPALLTQLGDICLSGFVYLSVPVLCGSGLVFLALLSAWFTLRVLGAFHNR